MPCSRSFIGVLSTVISYSVNILFDIVHIRLCSFKKENVERAVYQGVDVDLSFTLQHFLQVVRQFRHRETTSSTQNNMHRIRYYLGSVR